MKQRLSVISVLVVVVLFFGEGCKKEDKNIIIPFADSEAYAVLNYINADRESLSLNPLFWNRDWAAACTAHATGLERAGNDGCYPNDLDDQNKQLMDFDMDPATGYHIFAIAMTFGAHATDAYDFYNKIKSVSSLWDVLMDPASTELGCGYCDDTWELMCSNP